MWAQDYPDEVEAIVGLDMVLPRTYDGFDFEGVFRYEKRGRHDDYASDLTKAKVIELGCGHYVHNFMQDRIAQEIRAFIGK